MKIEKTTPAKAFTRRVDIVEDGFGNFQSDAWSIHNKTGDTVHRGCAIHPGFDEHKARAEAWVNREELYFF